MLVYRIITIRGSAMAHEQWSSWPHSLTTVPDVILVVAIDLE